jgi:hypothetical protein
MPSGKDFRWKFRIVEFKPVKHEELTWRLDKEPILMAEEWLDKRNCIVEKFDRTGYLIDKGHWSEIQTSIITLIVKEKIHEDHEDY